MNMVAHCQEPCMGTPVRYIDKTRDYYLSQGYEKPYQWAQYDDVPFTPLGKPLSECRVTLISTSEISIVGDTHPEDETRMGIVGGTYTIPSSLPASQLYSPSRSFDQAATTLEDVDAFFPTTHLHAAAQAGRIGGVTQRFHGVFNAYSQRRTRERDAPLVLERCKEDGADVAILVPVCPVCHQTISLVSRHLEANGIPTVILAAARDIVEHVGVARVVHTDFPLGNPCGEPGNAAQQREILEYGFQLLERAFLPRTTVQSPMRWSAGEAWKDLVFTPEQPWKSGETEQDWLRKKELYKKLKQEGKV
ncbi:reductase [Bordetella bronchiseptica]|uniref:Putative reductase n=1 Tax=Bordetella bronchiseptica 253 TaxID=568707 RepID=A0A0C6PBE3_BORBO|nr:reductase [Bordetella bronchiseptica]AWP77350.1 reductase [Bordetella bronchiseptica]AZW14939.1 reductase [Bordetella bronchiseptica]AZW24187.1 reductase [Bordetella bronchiseptica]QBS71473.1 reductase [Bordetella bronchiseptica]RFT74925.1 reductase [Bordetella bronchiseptica]